MTLQINEHSSDKVVVCNIPNYIVDCIPVGGSVTLTPHEVVTLKKSRQNPAKMTCRVRSRVKPTSSKINCVKIT